VGIVQLFFPEVAGLRVDGVWREGGTLHIRAATTRKRTRCPCCGRRSRRVQSFYRRTIADLSCAGGGVTLHLQVRRFWCRVRRCRQRIFCERLPAVAAPWARKTPRLREHLRRDALAMGGERGARHATAAGTPVSARTLLRLVRTTPLPTVGRVRVLGVDDWARRKGRTYGTILVDLEAHRVVDLLPDRTGATLSAWLGGHPEIGVVSRDRATAYAEGIRQGAPQATEVADRFHILKNLTEAVEQVVNRHHAALRAAARPADAPASPPEVPTHAPTKAQRDREARRARRQARYDEVVALHEQGYSQNQIACALGMGRHTIRRFLRAAGFPERAAPQPRRSLLQRYDAYLRERWAAGCDNAHELWEELRAKGYSGSESHVRHYVAAWREQPSRPGKKGPRPLGSPRRPPPACRRVPAPREATWFLLRDPATLTADQTAYLERLRLGCPALAAVEALAHDFQTLMRQRDIAALDDWLQHAEASDAPELRGFAAGIRADYAAVAASLTLEWSQGQVEGQVNRLKETKREMYGRANFDLLRLRVLHPV
jgi:transposase